VKLLVVGSGGREHCLVWKLAQSQLVDKLYCAPGNGGTAAIAENLDIAATDIDKLLEFAKAESIDLTVVGPEAPLVCGIVDKFDTAGLKVFGPTKELALLEGSKVFAKEVMRKFSIPTADFKVFSDPQKAKQYISQKGAPLVVKADGLAAGKGVIVAKTVKEAMSSIDMIMVDKKFGLSGDRVIIEDCLEGQEASILVFSDGENIVPLVSSQDHKAAFDGDSGPNTGGMGAYSPAPLVNDQLLKKIIDQVFKPLIGGLKAENKAYKGILYAGLMIKDEAISVLEFNVRFGDPETQSILPKLKSDLVDLMLKTVEGKLNQLSLEWDQRFCLSVVLASGGYPGSYEKGKEIKGLDKLNNLGDIFVFHAGTKVGAYGSVPLTNGGRVLAVVGLADTLKEAQAKTYKAIENIQFDNMFYRKDIGSKALKGVKI